MEEQNQHSSSKNASGEKNLLEWIIFGIGVILTSFVIGYLIYASITFEKTPPDVQAEYKIDTTANSPNRIRITVKNLGTETAEAVVVEAKLLKLDQELEKAELMLQFVPRHSKRQGWITFSKSIQAADTIELRVMSYKKP